MLVELGARARLSRFLRKPMCRSSASTFGTAIFTFHIHGHVCRIASVVKASGCDVPEWMTALKKSSRFAYHSCRGCLSVSYALVFRSSKIKILDRDAIATDLAEKAKVVRMAKEAKAKKAAESPAEPSAGAASKGKRAKAVDLSE